MQARWGSQSWCAPCRLLLVDCTSWGESFLHQGVSTIHPCTCESTKERSVGVGLCRVSFNSERRSARRIQDFRCFVRITRPYPLLIVLAEFRQTEKPTDVNVLSLATRNMVTSGYTNAAEYDIAGASFVHIGYQVIHLLNIIPTYRYWS